MDKKRQSKSFGERRLTHLASPVPNGYKLVAFEGHPLTRVFRLMPSYPLQFSPAAPVSLIRRLSDGLFSGIAILV